ARVGPDSPCRARPALATAGPFCYQVRPGAGLAMTVDYFYLYEPHLYENPDLGYTVTVQPPPADVSKAEFHKNSATRAVFHREPHLHKEGEGSVPPDLKAKGLKIEDSPLFVQFTFSKGSESRMRRDILCVISLATPAVRAIYAPPEAYPDEVIELQVLSWDA